MTPGFDGWPPAMYAFWEGLAASNDRGWFAAHRHEFDEHVLAPMQSFLSTVEHLGPARIFRLHRDVRFSADKTPYKTQLGATIDLSARGVLYLHVDATGITIGSGFPALDASGLERFRRAVEADASGAEIAQLVASLRQRGHAVGTVQGGVVGGCDLKRVPRPFAPDHPRGELLRLKRLLAAQHQPHPAWLHTGLARDRILATWDAQSTLGAWGERHLR